MNNSTDKNTIEILLQTCIQKGASDMHISCDKPVSYRVNGQLCHDEQCLFDEKAVSEMARSIMNQHQQKEFTQRLTADIGYTADSGDRFRINCYKTMGQTALAVRHLNQMLLSFEAMGLPSQIKDLAYLPSGLVLVTGATGSGKSTTLAALIDEVNKNRNCHILTVEDPVEFVHENKKSLVHHRELSNDVPSFADAVRDALREDPDVIMVGEMRDLETMQASITAAETGHLVFSTLHTGEAVGAIERFIGHFSNEEQAVARHRISMVLKAVIAQRLIKTVDGNSRLPAVEMLRITNGAANLIRTSKTRQLYSMMECGAKDGMWTLDQDLAKLVKNNQIKREDALSLCQEPDHFDKHVNAVGHRGMYECQ